MGYSTYFNGNLQFDQSLSEGDIDMIKAFVEGDKPPMGAPSSYCPWDIDDSGEILFPRNEEKAYNWEEWLRYILKVVGVKASGRVYWNGEGAGDAGVIFVKDSQVKVVKVRDIPEPNW